MQKILVDGECRPAHTQLTVYFEIDDINDLRNSH